MAGASYVLDKTYKCTSASMTQYVCVMPDASDGSSDGAVKFPTGANVAMMGVTQEAQATANENVVVRKLGITRVKANAAINAGAFLRIAATTGFVEPVVLSATGGTIEYIVGKAETSATAQGDIIKMQILEFCAEGST